MHFGRATIAEGVSKQSSNLFKVMQKRQSCGFWYGQVYSHMHLTLIKAVGCVKGVMEFYAEKHQLPSMTSTRCEMGKRLMIYWCFSSTENRRIKEIIRLECNPSNN